ncbi:MAG TPA: GGDEF domain-containing protein [Pseudomonas sp.]|uniref:GGDEF domain-containing protein n=1 Tax=Pseudomonas sp. TaxID=306 RepID=UPI002C8F94CF|nr:GGDEF domain-containing protein [Pseudomonas sp.]HSX89736.1 GGDEF domain-containing protein [Pseudomonas sp.]
MKLSDFIRLNMEPILDEWADFARQVQPALHFDADQLRDHAHGMLETIANDIENKQSAAQQQDKSRGRGPRLVDDTQAELHGAARLVDGFSINEAMAEFRALRASVLRLWSESEDFEPDAFDEMTRFNEAIDQALTESLTSYSELRDRQTRLFDALLSTSPDLNLIIDTDGTILYANRAAAERFGKSSGEMNDANFFQLCAPFAPEMQLYVRHVVGARTTDRGEMSFDGGAGKMCTYEYLLMPVLDPHGRCEAVAATARDISERKASEERVRHSANYDHLTDLPNRALFRERLELELRHSTRTGLPLALLYIDLDGFKEVNDRLGHAAGDELLQQVGRRIGGCVRDTDMVARLGGDEFTVILTDITQPLHVQTLCQKILTALSQPFMLKAGQAGISASIGVTSYPGDAASLDELIRNADAAMYEAKNAGRNRFSVFRRVQ